MTRAEAVALLVEARLDTMTKEERESLLLDWWSIDEDDVEFTELPPQLRLEILETEEPELRSDRRYDPLMRIALRERFLGVRNEYLEKELAGIGISERVFGDVEILEACPCCGHRTLRARGTFEICEVCFWEDDGSEDPDRVSGPNHLTLREARENFLRFGAMSEAVLGLVTPDGTDRFIKS